jgi:AcrR family transcriptional regulator
MGLITQSARKRTEQAYDDRREEIIEAAIDAFCENGFSRTSMLDIATRARASKETIYAWFGNKEKLFETILHEHYDKVLSESMPEKDLADPRAFLIYAARAILTLLSSPRIARLMIVTLAEGPKFNAGLRILVERSMIGRPEFIAQFERWRALGLMHFEQDAEQIFSVFVSMARGEWQDRLILGLIPTVTPEQIDSHARFVTDLFLKAVAPPGRSAKQRGGKKLKLRQVV